MERKEYPSPNQCIRIDFMCIWIRFVRDVGDHENSDEYIRLMDNADCCRTIYFNMDK